MKFIVLVNVSIGVQAEQLNWTPCQHRIGAGVVETSSNFTAAPQGAPPLGRGIRAGRTTVSHTQVDRTAFIDRSKAHAICIGAKQLSVRVYTGCPGPGVAGTGYDFTAPGAVAARGLDRAPLSTPSAVPTSTAIASSLSGSTCV